MNILKNIDLKNGKVVYYDFKINFKLSFDDQKWSYKEDLVQISFQDGKYLIDVGWYPEFNPNGAFLISVIKDNNWMNPIFQKKGKTKDALINYIKEAITVI